MARTHCSASESSHPILGVVLMSYHGAEEHDRYGAGDHDGIAA